jgi:uncharacterized repeat protein (TIGR01451 family)
MKTIISIIALISMPVTFAVADPDIEVQKSVDNAIPMANEPVEFTVQVNNIGADPATGVVIIDQLPMEMAIPDGTAAFPSTGTYDPVTGEWTIGDLDPGAGAVLVVPAIVTEPNPPDCIVNRASSQFDDFPDDANNEGRAVVYQNGADWCVDLGVEFGISASDPFEIFPTCDSQDSYQGKVEVTNHGPDAARNVLVTVEQVPVVGPNLRFDDADCDNGPSSQCEIAEIGAGETITINVTSDLYQSYTNFTQTISVTASTSDVEYDLTNNEPSSTGTAGGFSSCEEIDFGLGNIGAVGPGCFIATAAYGSPLDSRLDVLRNFRDQYMLTNGLGRTMVAFYYRHSPVLADFIAERDWLRAVVRGMLAPIVFSIEHPPWGLASLLALIGMVLAVRRHRVRSGALRAAGL